MSGKRILLVDDESSVAEVVQMILEQDGHEIEVVDNPLEALATFRPEKYDLVLTDSCMPEMTGLELAEKIKRMSPEQPVILLTGFLPSGPMPGVDMVMFKPFSSSALRRAVADLTVHLNVVP